MLLPFISSLNGLTRIVRVQIDLRTRLFFSGSKLPKKQPRSQIRGTGNDTLDGQFDEETKGNNICFVASGLGVGVFFSLREKNTPTPKPPAQ